VKEVTTFSIAPYWSTRWLKKTPNFLPHFFPKLAEISREALATKYLAS
jgi:hypothetical protein